MSLALLMSLARTQVEGGLRRKDGKEKVENRKQVLGEPVEGRQQQKEVHYNRVTGQSRWSNLTVGILSLVTP